MKFLKTSIAALALSAFAGNAYANDGSGAYGNIGVDMFNADIDDGSATAWALSGVLGYNFTENFGIEGQGSFGIAGEEVDGVDFGLDSSFAGFGVVRLPAGENFDIFARGGYHFSQISASNGGVSIGVDTDGFAVGAGGQYFFSPNDGVRLEYTYYDLQVGDVAVITVDDSGSANSVKLSYVRKF